MKSTKEMQTNEVHYANTNKWNILSNCKQIKHIRQLQTNEAHYATAKKWSTLCTHKKYEEH